MSDLDCSCDDALKGEILAGNDNKEMVKNFKIILLRFMNSGKIPRRQGQEILTDLVSWVIDLLI